MTEEELTKQVRDSLRFGASTTLLAEVDALILESLELSKLATSIHHTTVQNLTDSILSQLKVVCQFRVRLKPRTCIVCPHKAAVKVLAEHLYEAEWLPVLNPPWSQQTEAFRNRLVEIVRIATDELIMRSPVWVTVNETDIQLTNITGDVPQEPYV